MGKKILYRTGKNRVVAGVCGGTAEYFEIDPGIIRVIWILSVLAAGAGVWAYLVAWTIVPENPGGNRKDFRMNTKVEIKGDKKNMLEGGLTLHRKSSIFGLSLMIIGVIFLANNFMPQLRLDKYWPIIPIALGLVLIFSSYNHKK